MVFAWFVPDNASSSVSSGLLLPSTCLSSSSASSSSSPSLSPVLSSLSSMPWSPSSSSLLQLTKSSVTLISSAKLSQSPTSVKTSSSKMLLLKPTSSYSTSNTLTMPSMEPSWVGVQDKHCSQNLHVFVTPFLCGLVYSSIKHTFWQPRCDDAHWGDSVVEEFM